MKPQVGELWQLNGNQMARILVIRGILSKRYLCAVWGVDELGRHSWPNGSVSHYENWIDRSEFKKRVQPSLKSS